MAESNCLTTSTQLSTADSVVDDYFQTFNQNDFDKTAALFAAAGELDAPFESPVVGRAAILAYLQQEATAMSAFPSTRQSQVLADGNSQIVVGGQAHAIAFKVNVEWRFVITPQAELAKVHVKLLASLKDLMKLRPQA